MLSKQVTAAVIAAIFTALASTVHGHGHLVSPRSRNYVAKQDGVWWPADDTTPYPEDCPHCLNIGGTEARCGFTAGRNYDYPKNALGGSLAPDIQACYGEGDVVQLDVVLTAHHMGHFSYKACAINAGEVASQECFDSNPLTFVEDVLYGSLPDPNHPNRAYIPRTDSALIQRDNGGDYKFSHRFKLPEDLSGELVLLQWHYITANSCFSDEGYLNYDFPAGFEPNLQVGVCDFIPPDGRGVPEQFWNCAEIRISSDCAGNPPSPSPPMTPPPQTTTQATTTTTTTSTSVSPPPPPAPSSCPAENNACGPNNPCSNGMCCSQWGYCGTTEGYCGECCQSNCSGQPPSPPSPSPPPPSPPTSNPPPSSGFNYNADHGEDSRLIAYVGNWQDCPTDEQIDAYSHIVIAFAVSYTWSAAKNNCDSQCQVSSSLPLCGNQAHPDLIDKWRGMGKKVIMSFGGAGMGGSWSGDSNNCWDYCFGHEDRLSTDLANMIDAQNLDGIDIDYEYCYDVAGNQAGRCGQRSSLYSDEKAQLFLNSMTSLLRTKLDALQASNGYSRGRYEVTHAPMDTDLLPDSKYFEILHERRADLDFLMPQFYNGYTRAGIDGFDGTGAGSMRASTIYSSLANDMFDNEPNKVVFGHCISDCSGTGSNVNANQAVTIQQEIKEFNNGEFGCNGGAFFWVATHDVGGGWSDAVVSEVSLSAGCSNSQTTSSTVATTTTTTTVTLSPSKAPTSPPNPEPTSEPSSAPTTSEPTEKPTTIQPTQAPTALTPAPTDATPQPTQGMPTSEPTSEPTPLPSTPYPTAEPNVVTASPTKPPQSTPQPTPELVVSRENRCGQNELHARETCGNVCQSLTDCGPGEYCWGVHPNYCGSITKRVYVDPAQSTVWTRCGTSELDARSFCGEPCTWQCAEEGETCQSVHANYCDSEYYIE